MMEDEGLPGAIEPLPRETSAALVPYMVRAEMLVIGDRDLPVAGRSLRGRPESGAGPFGPAGGDDRHWSDQGL